METKNLVIRKFIVEDLDYFKELIRDKMNSEMAIYDDQFPTDDNSLKSIFDYFMTTDEFMGVALKENNTIIGFVSLNRIDDISRNLGYCINSKYQGLGYATEAVGALINYAKYELKLKKLVSGTAKNNIPSVELLKHLNFIETKSSIASFVNDDNGNPIEFIAASYELCL